MVRARGRKSPRGSLKKLHWKTTRAKEIVPTQEKELKKRLGSTKKPGAPLGKRPACEKKKSPAIEGGRDGRRKERNHSLRETHGGNPAGKKKGKKRCTPKRKESKGEDRVDAHQRGKRNFKTRGK